MPLKRLSEVPHSVGGMRHWIVLYARGERLPDGGDAPPSPAIETWGRVREIGGRYRPEEWQKAMQIAQEVGHIVEIPYQLGVTEDMLVMFQNRRFEIKGIVDTEETRMFLDLYCAEIGQNAGEGA